MPGIKLCHDASGKPLFQFPDEFVLEDAFVFRLRANIKQSFHKIKRERTAR